MSQTPTTQTLGTAVATVLQPQIDKLKAKLPPLVLQNFGPMIDQYAPTLIAMSTDDLATFVANAVSGNSVAAYAALLKGLDADGLHREWQAINAAWATANAANADHVAAQKSIALQAVQAALQVGLTLLAGL